MTGYGSIRNFATAAAVIPVTARLAYRYNLQIAIGLKFL